MPGENSRVARAGDYILGLMNDTERERAERDLEVDAAFRDTVMEMAERMGMFDRALPEPERTEDRWKHVAGRIAELPQMQLSVAGGSAQRPIVPSYQKPHGQGLHALPRRAALVIALALIAAFALGYLVGRL